MERKSGFSLIEVMVISAIFLVIVAGVSNLIISLMGQVTYVESRTTRAELHNYLFMKFQDEETCEKTLVGKNPNQGANISIVNKDDSVFLEVGNQDKNKYGNLTIESISLNNPEAVANDSFGLVEIEIEFEPLGRRELNALKVNVPVQLDATGAVASCSAEADDAGQQQGVNTYRVSVPQLNQYVVRTANLARCNDLIGRNAREFLSINACSRWCTQGCTPGHPECKSANAGPEKPAQPHKGGYMSECGGVTATCTCLD